MPDHLDAMPFLSIEDGQITCDLRRKMGRRRYLKYPVNAKGLREMGRELRTLEVQEWLCSSSVDFPLQYGARRNYDVQSLVMEGFNGCQTALFNEHVTKVAKEEELTEEQVRTILQRFGCLLVEMGISEDTNNV